MEHSEAATGYTGYTLPPQLTGDMVSKSSARGDTVHEAMQRQSAALDALAKAVGPLEERLAAVLVPPSPVAELAGDRVASDVQLAAAIGDHTDRILAFARHVEQITQRLGI